MFSRNSDKVSPTFCLMTTKCSIRTDSQSMSQFTFHQSSAENLSFLEDQSVDLTIAGLSQLPKQQRHSKCNATQPRHATGSTGLKYGQKLLV